MLKNLIMHISFLGAMKESMPTPMQQKYVHGNLAIFFLNEVGSIAINNKGNLAI